MLTQNSKYKKLRIFDIPLTEKLLAFVNISNNLDNYRIK